MDIPTIPEFFSGKNIFITGASGFLGKALIEKILRSCPDVGNIYILIRSKRGKNLFERTKILTENSVFDRLKKEYPSLKMDEKIIPLSGNVYELNLGLNDNDRNLIIDNVSIIFHVAASVRFDDNLTYATLLNIRGTREVCQLALDCKKLIAYMHVSTAYSNCDKFHIKEEMYPPKADWKKLIQIAETCDTYILSAVTQIYMNHMPNTYVFTKQIAESVVSDMLTGKVPALIYRPSIVCSAIKEPMIGWVDNFNGPIGILVAYAKGIMRTCCVSNENIPDYIPIDIVTKLLIISIWDFSIRQNKSEIEVLHGTNNSTAKWLCIDKKIIIDIGPSIAKKLPTNTVLWTFAKNASSYKEVFYFETIFYMLIPSMFVDVLLKLSGRKPMVMKLVTKMYNVQIALLYFTQNNWTLVNDKLFDLQKKIKSQDRDNWDYEFRYNDTEQYVYNCMLGCRRYLLNEPDDTIPQAKRNFERMKLLKKILCTILYISIGYILWKIFLNKVF